MVTLIYEEKGGGGICVCGCIMGMQCLRVRQSKCARFIKKKKKKGNSCETIFDL